jgi:hypothetical protein
VALDNSCSPSDPSSHRLTTGQSVSVPLCELGVRASAIPTNATCLPPSSGGSSESFGPCCRIIHPFPPEDCHLNAPSYLLTSAPFKLGEAEPIRYYNPSFAQAGNHPITLQSTYILIERTTRFGGEVDYKVCCSVLVLFFCFLFFFLPFV